MATPLVFDVAIVGGGLAGSTLAGVLARAGLGVVVFEKEARFRDRIRGEFTWPWGVADVRQLGLDDMLAQAGVVEVRALKFYADRQPMETVWERTAPDDVPGMGFSHPRFQEAAFGWAAAQGAMMLRPTKVTRVVPGGSPTLTVSQDGHEVEYRARLVVAADGKLSAARRWIGGESLADPEHHRIGGVLVAGATYDRSWVSLAAHADEAAAWIAAGADLTRLYLVMSQPRLRETGVDRAFAAFVSYAAAFMPEGILADVQQAGPIGFFPNNDIWASRVAGNGVVLIGDAAGAVDPTGAHGTSMLFRDVRVLSELLLSSADWDKAIDAFAERRRRAYEVIRADDRWATVFFDTSNEAAQLREGHERAKANDPTLGGFSFLATNGPDGVVANEAARRHYFGEDLA
jgi:2-polyprenyl-6-methoxyphenol hydroxylase-like FAD-dependent oxidoreductase